MILPVVASVMQRPWNWSLHWHCLGDACDVFQALWGVDPMARLRSQYGDIRGALGLVQEAGGMDALAAREFEAMGLVRCDETPGAIGIGQTGKRRMAMICIKPGVWAGKSQRGFVLTECKAEAWTCQH